MLIFPIFTKVSEPRVAHIFTKNFIDIIPMNDMIVCNIFLSLSFLVNKSQINSDYKDASRDIMCKVNQKITYREFHQLYS